MSMADNRMRYGLLVLLLGPSSLQAQAPRSDSTRVPLIRTSELVGITAAIGIGFALDGTVRGDAQEDRTGTSNNLAKIGNGIGNPIYLGPALAVTWAVGTLTHNRSIRIAAQDAFAAGAIAGGLTAVLKVGFGRARPNALNGPGDFRPFSKNASFPSGHTTLAMAVATSLAHSTKDHWSDVLFYSAALVTGYARINDDKHWLSDVITGGAIGYLVGRQIHFRGSKITPLVGAGVVGGSIAF